MPEHVADRAGAEPRSGRRLRRHRVRRGDERIGAVIDVEQRALRTFEQDALALAALLIEQRPHRIHERQHGGRHGLEFLAHLPRVDRIEPETLAQRVVMGQQAFDLALERRAVGQIHQADRAPPDFVLVCRADAAPRRADAQRRARRFFADGVELAVQRQDERRRSRRCADCPDVTATPCFFSVAISFSSACGSSTTPLPMTDNFPGRTTPGGQQRKLVGDAVDDQRVAGIVAALEADHDIGLLGQPVDDLTFALVAPLGADHDNIRHEDLSPTACLVFACTGCRAPPIAPPAPDNRCGRSKQA